MPNLSNNGRPAGRIIFVVEDDVAHLTLCERVLNRAGYVVLTATTRADVLRTLEFYPIDLVLVDVFAEKDGFEMVQELRRRHPHLIVITMSSVGVIANSDDVVASCTRLDADAVLFKPFTCEQLTQAVADALELSQPASRTADEMHHVEPSPHASGRVSGIARRLAWVSSRLTV